MYRTVDAERNGDGQGQNGGKDIQEYGVFHTVRNNLRHRFFIHGGLAKVALKHAVKGVGLLILGKAHPSGVADDQRVVQSVFIAQLLVSLRVFLGFQGFFQRFQLRAGRV